MTANTATILSVISLAISAAAWLIAAIAAPVIKKSYWDRLPASLIARQKIAGFGNLAGALFASIGVALQAYSTYATWP